MDIGSKCGYPASSLSNFSPHPFVIDGVECSSMEGFLQSLKFSSIDMQKHVCTLVGLAAKRKGAKKAWWRTQTLYWQGVEYPRKSKKEPWRTGEIAAIKDSCSLALKVKPNIATLKDGTTYCFIDQNLGKELGLWK